MASAYDPATELVLVLLKPNERSSTYRVCVIAPGLFVARKPIFGLRWEEALRAWTCPFALPTELPLAAAGRARQRMGNEMDAL